jgi:squalene-hopene/tetraprenyl-beta-curcumene cyclase
MTRRAPWILALSVALAACGKDDEPKTGGGGAAKGGAAGGYGYGYAANLGADLDKKVGEGLLKAKNWLLSKRDEKTGAWGRTEPKDARVGYTALVVQSLVGATRRESVGNDPVILAGLQFVADHQKPDGSVYGNDAYVNYETSAAVGAFASAKVAKYQAAQAKARDFLAASQIQGDENDPSFGGFPYKKGQATDLSNLQFAVTALHDAGLPADSPVFARVQKYLSRVQNRTETNTFVAKAKVGDAEVEVVPGNDGGAFYAPGASKADLVKRPDGKYEAKSYGSMTYALVKCLLFSGAKPDDPRVVSAVAWLSRNFALDRNPGFETAPDPAKAGAQGYFYYFRTMARALAEMEKAAGKAWTITDASGRAHEWRKELAEKVLSLQKADGSWRNEQERWEEGDPVIATAYLVETLATCQGRLP